MSRPLRLCCYAGLTLLVVLAIDTGAWWFLTSRLASEAASWQRARSAEGYTVTAGPPRRAGWPLQAELILPAVEVATGPAGSANAMAWRTPEARLVYTPWHPGDVTVVLAGAQTLQLGVAPAIALRVEALDLVVPLDQAGQVDGIVVTARHVNVPFPTGSLGADSLWLRLGAADMHLSVAALTLPGPALPLGGTIGSLDLQAHSTIPLPEQRDPAAAATAWRDEGGQLIVGDATLGWGPLTIHGVASFGLDQALQPVGNGKLRIAGYAEAIAALAQSGLITRNNAKVATTLLGLMSHTGNDAVPEADLPFTVHDGVLASGAIPLLKLPRLALP